MRAYHTTAAMSQLGRAILSFQWRAVHVAAFFVFLRGHACEHP